MREEAEEERRRRRSPPLWHQHLSLTGSSGVDLVWSHSHHYHHPPHLSPNQEHCTNDPFCSQCKLSPATVRSRRRWREGAGGGKDLENRGLPITFEDIDRQLSDKNFSGRIATGKHFRPLCMCFTPLGGIMREGVGDDYNHALCFGHRRCHHSRNKYMELAPVWALREYHNASRGHRHAKSVPA